MSSEAAARRLVMNLLLRACEGKAESELRDVSKRCSARRRETLALTDNVGIPARSRELNPADVGGQSGPVPLT